MCDCNLCEAAIYFRTVIYVVTAIYFRTVSYVMIARYPRTEFINNRA